MSKVLFVCTGNTCRSPMAEALAIDHFKKKGITSHTFSSRGINVMLPSRAEHNAVTALRTEFNISLLDHIARQLTEDDLISAYIILTMTKAHATYLTSTYKPYSDKILTLSEITDMSVGDITDPFGRDIYEYKKCAKIIQNCIEHLVLPQ